jgi:hypothetical protein
LNFKNQDNSDTSSNDESIEEEQIEQRIHSNLNNASSAIEDESEDGSFSNFSNGHVSVGLISGGGIKALDKKSKSNRQETALIGIGNK